MIYVCVNRKAHQDDIPMEIAKVFVTHPVPGNWIVNIVIDYRCPRCGHTSARILAFDAKKEAIV